MSTSTLKVLSCSGTITVAETVKLHKVLGLHWIFSLNTLRRRDSREFSWSSIDSKRLPATALYKWRWRQRQRLIMIGLVHVISPDYIAVDVVVDSEWHLMTTVTAAPYSSNEHTAACWHSCDYTLVSLLCNTQHHRDTTQPPTPA